MTSTTETQTHPTSAHGATDQIPASSAVEREDLIAALAHARHFLRYTTRDLTEEQVRQRTTPSAFCLGDIIKHLTEVERSWSDFLVAGKAALAKDGRDFIDWTPEEFAELGAEATMQPEDTLVGVLAEHERAAAATDARIRELPTLDTVRELPKTPWPMDAEWSARRAILHILAETTQHAGHADIIREALDGAKSMG